MGSSKDGIPGARIVLAMQTILETQVTPQKVVNKSSSFSLSFDKRDYKVSLEITSKELDFERIKLEVSQRV